MIKKVNFFFFFLLFFFFFFLRNDNVPHDVDSFHFGFLVLVGEHKSFYWMFVTVKIYLGVFFLSAFPLSCWLVMENRVFYQRF